MIIINSNKRGAEEKEKKIDGRWKDHVQQGLFIIVFELLSCPIMLVNEEQRIQASERGT